jgi:hypothetical protein
MVESGLSLRRGYGFQGKIVNMLRAHRGEAGGYSRSYFVAKQRAAMHVFCRAGTLIARLMGLNTIINLGELESLPINLQTKQEAALLY